MSVSFDSLLTHWAFKWDEVQYNLPKGIGFCLDLGCGNGQHRAWVESGGWTWVGLDVDVTRGGALIQSDASHLPFVNESFELVLFWQVLEHLPQPWIALSEVNRVLKPGGFVIGSVSCLEPFHDVCSYFGFTHKGIEQVLKDCGFINIKIQPGLNAFSLIARSWFQHILGAKWGERVAFALVRISFAYSLRAYLFLRQWWNFIRRGKIGEDYKKTVGWLAHQAPLEFAGHLRFEAYKKK